MFRMAPNSINSDVLDLSLNSVLVIQFFSELKEISEDNFLPMSCAMSISSYPVEGGGGAPMLMVRPLVTKF